MKELGAREIWKGRARRRLRRDEKIESHKATKPQFFVLMLNLIFFLKMRIPGQVIGSKPPPPSLPLPKPNPLTIVGYPQFEGRGVSEGEKRL